MCGICGVLFYGDKFNFDITPYLIKNMFKTLLKNSESRGTDSTGIALLSNNKITVYKDKKKAGLFLEDKQFNEILDSIELKSKFKAILGHVRSQTKGTFTNNRNNHPIVAGNVVGVHNGIISNDDELFKKYNLPRTGKVDSEIIFRLIDRGITNGLSIIESVKDTLSEIVGTATGAFITADNTRYVTLFKNTHYKSLAIRLFKNSKIIAFASSEYILDKSKPVAMLNKYTDLPMLNNEKLIIRIDLDNAGRIYIEHLN